VFISNFLQLNFQTRFFQNFLAFGQFSNFYCSCQIPRHLQTFPDLPNRLSLIDKHHLNQLSDHQDNLCAFVTYREIRGSNFQGIHCLKHSPLTLILQIVKGSFLCHEVRVANDGPHKESVISYFLTSSYSLATKHTEHLTTMTTS